MRLSRKLLITTLIGVLLVASYFALKLTRPFSPFRYFAQTNITPFSSTFVWTSATPTKGCILVLRLPLQFQCDTKAYNHHLTIDNLTPTKHTFILFSGLNAIIVKTDHSFIPEDMPALPNPAYGHAPPGSVITVQTPRSNLSALSSADGTWSLDLRDSFEPGTVLPVTLDYQYSHLADYVITIGNHQPVPDFILTNEQAERPTQ